MMISLSVPEDMLARLRRHLFPPRGVTEEAAFLLLHCGGVGTDAVLKAVDMRLLQPEDFASREGDYLELAEEVRPEMIKWAHVARGGLVEVHSHPGPYAARFSLADHAGLAETVPHMKWRLKGRPYVALVFSERDFDALVWLGADTAPCSLDAIDTGNRLITPTNLSIEDLGHGK